MKHTFTDTELQAAIDGACIEIHREHRWKCGISLVIDTVAAPSRYKAEASARLDLIKSAIAALPEPPTPTVDVKTPGQACYEARFTAATGRREWRDLTPPEQVKWESAASAVLAAFGNQPQPAEIPWTEWHGGECPLKDEEVEKFELKFRGGLTCIGTPKPSAYFWEQEDDRTDIIAYRVLKWKEGFGTVDWKAKFEEAEKKLREAEEGLYECSIQETADSLPNSRRIIHQYDAKSVLAQLTDFKARAEKAEADLAKSRECNSQLTKACLDWQNQIREIKAKPQLSQLRPIAEAGAEPPTPGQNGVIPWGFELWQHLHQEHGLILTESEMQEIVRLAEPLVTKPITPPTWTPAVGDVVQIKSGGPKMTVMQDIGHKFFCAYDSHGEVKTVSTPAVCLQPV